MTEPWVPGVFIDEAWHFSTEQVRAIRGASRLDAQTFEQRLPELTSITQDYRAFARHEDARPARKTARPQLARLAAAADALGKAIDGLDASAREHLEDPIDDPQCLDLGRFAEQVSAWGAKATRFHGRGRPREDALGILVNRLALFWESAHGRWPGRVVDSFGKERGGPFGRFVHSVLAAIEPGHGRPDGIIRTVLRGRRHMEKNGRASVAKP